MNSVNQELSCHLQVEPKQVETGYLSSIVLPIYNEATCIGETFAAVFSFAKAHPTSQFIFVNDGSSDRTQELLETAIWAAATEQIHLISYGERCGKGHAVRVGVAAAAGAYICFIDGDLAYSLDHVDRLLEQLQHADVVIGSRSLVQQQFYGLKRSRRVAGRVFNFLSNLILGLNYRDMQAGLKGFRRQAALDLFGQQQLTGFSFDVELIYLAKKKNYSIREIPAQVADDHGSKVSQVKLVQDSARMFLDLLKIRYNDLLGHYK